MIGSDQVCTSNNNLYTEINHNVQSPASLTNKGFEHRNFIQYYFSRIYIKLVYNRQGHQEQGQSRGQWYRYLCK